MIRIDGLDFAYRHGEFRLRVPELAVEDGATVAVIGPNGSGKTTLLHLVAGIATPRAGRIVVKDVEVSGLVDAARRDFRIANIGMVFQEFELLDYLSVLDNICLPYRITRVLRLDDAARERAAALADTVGLGDKLLRSPKKLSHGERQRVAVCRALLTRPPLLLSDEPTGNLDPKNKERVLDILFAYVEETGATLLTVTHDHTVLGRFARTVDVEEWGGA